MPRNYTDRQLEKMAEDEAVEREFTYQGGENKAFNRYEQTQEQRRMERAMRKQRALANGYKNGGNIADYRAAKAKYRAQLAEYRRFSREMNLVEQLQRVYADGIGRL